MTALSSLLQAAMRRAKIGSQTLSNVTGIPRTSIDNWREGLVHRPKQWRPLLQIAQVLLLDSLEADTLLAAAGYPAVATLATSLPVDHPDRRFLRPWLVSTSLAPQQGQGQRQHAVETGLSATVAPPQSLHQLRAPIADFVGRAQMIATLVSTLQSAADNGAIAAISGVRGMGGIGKTELAYVVAQRLRGTFPDAQIVVPLQGTSAAPLPVTHALRTVISAFTPAARLPNDVAALQAQYHSVLHGQRALILADDARDAAQVQPLLPPPGCALLVTSRQRFILPGMTAIDLEQLDADAAVALLQSICDRLTRTDAQALAQTCGYLPLALRISASILHSDVALSVAGYLAHLRDEQQRLRHLRDPDNSGLDVAASLALSYAQLTSVAQHCFRQLGVFVADFATDMALAVVNAPAGADVEMTLRLLLRRNLIMYDAARARWRLHDLVRDLARSALEAAGEAEATMWRYAHAAVAHAAHAQAHYRAGGEQTLRALSQFDAERPHLDAARRWAQRRAAPPEGDQLLIDAALATRDIEDLRYDQRHEIIPLWEGVRTAARRLGDQREEARALSYLGVAAFSLGEQQTAITYYEQHLAIVRAMGDHRIEGKSLGNLGGAYNALGEQQTAITSCEQHLALAREMGDRRSEGNALDNLGLAYACLGQQQTAITYYEQALSIARALGDRRSEGHILGNLGGAYACLGEQQTASTCYEQALSIARAMGDRRSEGIALINLGSISTDLGDLRRAIDACEQAGRIARAIGDQQSEGYSLSSLARAQALQGDMARACTTYTQACTRLRDSGDRRGAAECQWRFGLALAQQGHRAEALPLLRAAVTYEQEIGHAKAAEHAALLARLEAGEPLSPEPRTPGSQRSRVDEEGPPHDDASHCVLAIYPVL